MKKFILLLLGFLALSPFAFAQTIPGGGGGGGSSPCSSFGTTAGTCLQGAGALGTPSSGTATNITGLVPSTGLAATGTPDSSHALFGDNTWKTVAGSGTVTSITAGNGINLSTNPCVATCTASTTVTLNPQTAAGYAVVAGDGGKLVTRANAGAIGDTLAQSTGSLGGGYGTNYGVLASSAGSATLTVTTSTVSGLSALGLAPGQWATIFADGVGNYQASVSLPLIANNRFFGNNSGSTSYGNAMTGTQATALLDLATSSAFGVVKVDGTTITASGGVISAVGGSGTVTTLTAGTNITFSSGATCTTTCTINSSGGGSAYTATFSGNASGTPGAAGLGVAFATATLTDNNTAGSGTAALSAFIGVAAPTFAATNSSVVTTHASSLRIAGVPIAGTNNTLTATSAFSIAAGDSVMESATAKFRMYNVGSPGITNREEVDFGWGSNVFTISTVANGTGTARALALSAGGALNLNAATGSAIQFQINAANIFSIGASSFASANGSGAAIGTGASSATAPVFWPIKGSTTTGIGGTAGNISLIDAGTEIERITSTGPRYVTIPTDATKTDASVCRDTTTGDLYTGTGTIGICLGTSSMRYKHGIADIQPDLLQIMQLKPKSYFLNADHGNPNKRFYGFLAEDMVKVLPELVALDKQGRPNTADYLGLVPVLVKAMQQQQQEISALTRRLAVASAQINRLEAGGILKADWSSAGAGSVRVH